MKYFSQMLECNWIRWYALLICSDCPVTMWFLLYVLIQQHAHWLKHVLFKSTTVFLLELATRAGMGTLKGGIAPSASHYLSILVFQSREGRGDKGSLNKQGIREPAQGCHSSRAAFLACIWDILGWDGIRAENGSNSVRLQLAYRSDCHPNCKSSYGPTKVI